MQCLVQLRCTGSVDGVVSRPLAAGLRQFDTRRRFITSPVTASVSDERRRSAYLFLVKVPANHSAPSSAALLHWLKAPERIAFKQSVLVYKCLHGSAPAYLNDKLCQVADVEARPVSYTHLTLPTNREV